MDDAVRAYQEQASRLLDAAARQYYGSERGRAALDRLAAADAADPLTAREREIEAILAGLDEPDARWLLALIRAKFGRLEPITREVWARAKRG